MCHIFHIFHKVLTYSFLTNFIVFSPNCGIQVVVGKTFSHISGNKWWEAPTLQKEGHFYDNIETDSWWGWGSFSKDEGA